MAAPGLTLWRLVGLGGGDVTQCFLQLLKHEDLLPPQGPREELQLRASVCGLQDQNVTVAGEVGKKTIFHIARGFIENPCDLEADPCLLPDPLGCDPSPGQVSLVSKWST